jgi:hypothetical protein
MKTELEEVAETHCESITHPYCDREKAMFIKGAKWQAERMYSEEEVEKIAKDAYTMGGNNILIGVFNK